MNKKKKLILTIIASVVVIGGILGGTAVAFAQDEEEDQSQSFLDRVAAIYEANTGTSIDVDQLQAAVSQAHEEIRNERVESMFDKLVEEGILTQEEADEYKAWLDAKPDIDIGLPEFGQRFGNFFRDSEGWLGRLHGFTFRLPCLGNSELTDTQ